MTTTNDVGIVEITLNGGHLGPPSWISRISSKPPKNIQTGAFKEKCHKMKNKMPIAVINMIKQSML